MHVIEPLRISSLQGDYPVTFHPNVADGLEGFADLRDAYVIVDKNIVEFHRESIAPLTTSFPTLAVEADEVAKSLVGVGTLVNWLLLQRAVRSSTLIAIGGGCIQDLVSFTAHIYYRGIDWVFMPTTVLSQADSCIGAKSGINVLPLKNQLGVLHSPRQIQICGEFLETLPEPEIASGYGEIVKLSVTSSRHFLHQLESSLAEGGLRNRHLLSLERAALAAKQEIIEQDEYETDLRRVLNYGHSFGHALEVLANHRIPHGLAVLWGIDLVNALGVTWGFTPEALAHRMEALISKNFDYELPITPQAEQLVDMLRRDKKFADGLMYFVVLRNVGDLVIEPRPLDQRLVNEVHEVLAQSRVFVSS